MFWDLFRFKIDYSSNDCVLCVSWLLLIFCLNPSGFHCQFSHDGDPYAIRLCTTTLVLLHTGVGVWGTSESEYGYWLLTVRNAELAGGFPSDPILSGSRHTIIKY